MSYYTIQGIVRSSAPILAFTSIIGIAAGQIMNTRLDSLLSLPILLLLIPALIKIGGDTGSMLAARLASAFHMGLGTTQIHKNPVVRNSLIAAFIVGTSASVAVSVLVWIAGHFLTMSLPFLVIFQLCIIAEIFELIVVYAATLGIAIASHRFGLDPDDTIIPMIATLGDLVGVLAIFATINLFNII
ncbi:mgtE-like transporter [Methanohalophilus levihalophilus]|uniref:magnesium transporter n=1 Tax=Methanohalophilus levihalophilus TaxID=1431282 RepID=UPI001AE1CF6A|nr:magnesium transporter [Methanohalophilus levihalophilus]MBP2031306.1 mgtE-like transporter [Methanohalophilus levihalophilus]